MASGDVTVCVDGVQLLGPTNPETQPVVCEGALTLLRDLHRHFNAERLTLLQRRAAVHERILRGEKPKFADETRHIRHDPTWHVTPPPEGSRVRQRVVDVVVWRVFDAASVAPALHGPDGIQFDFDDSFAPSWANVLAAQRVLYDLTRRADWRSLALVLVRPRSLNLPERHVLIDGVETAGALVDFALWFHAWATSPAAQEERELYLYLPKLEHGLEARWWAQVFAFAEARYGFARGTVKALVLIENLLASFQMHEMLYELREHCLGLNTGKWDYIFSYIKLLRLDAACVVPDRAALGPEQPFLAAYERLVIRTAKQRKAFVTGGMAPFVASASPLELRERFEKVVAQKRRGAGLGLDGELVADVAYADAVRRAFQDPLPPVPFHLPTDEDELAALLVAVPQGACTRAGVAGDVRVALSYIESWLRGEGGLPLDGILEDLATAEITRTQLWQWQHHKVRLDDGSEVTPALLSELINEQLDWYLRVLGMDEFQHRRFKTANLLLRTLLDPEQPFVDFMPDLLYSHITTTSAAPASNSDT